MYMLKAVEETSKSTMRQIMLIRNQLLITLERVKKSNPKIYSKELVELLFEQPYSKIEYVVDRLKVERKTASRYLHALEASGIVGSKKIGRETIFINHDLIEILKK